MTLEEHARAIEAAILAAAEEGYELDDAYCTPIMAMDLNTVENGEFTESRRLSLPASTYY